MKRAYLLGVALALILPPSLSQAAPFVIGPATYSGNYYIYAYGDGYSTTTSGPTSLSLSANSIDPINHPATSAASLNISPTPFPTISASASANGGYSAVSGALSYQFSIVSSDPYDPANPVYVPTIVSYKGGASASSASVGATSSFLIAGNNFAESYRVTVGAAPLSLHQVNGITQPFSGTSFDEHKVYSMIANAYYHIDLLASATAGIALGSASAFIDPYIQIDPSFADAAKYSIVLSQGIGNIAGSVSTTPLPPALPMFGAGLLALGAIGYRKRRGSTI